MLKLFVDLVQVTAPAGQNWLELCNFVRGNKIDYPRMWDCDDQVTD